MFEPYEVTKRITVEDVYGTSNPPIPDGMRAKESRIRMPLKGEKYLGPFGMVLTAGDNHSFEDGDRPRIILAPVLTEIEERYGEGATPESVWAKYCPEAEKPKYGKPKFGNIPKGLSHGAILPKCGEFPPRFNDYSPQLVASLKTYVYAFPLNDWQILYGEEIPDAAALEAKLRAEGKLKENQFIEAELRYAQAGDVFVTKARAVYPTNAIFGGRRAIVGTRKRRYLKVPITETGVVKVTDLDECDYLFPGDFPGAQIIEE